MLKVGLEIKNGSKIFKPSKGDIIIFDGKEWYVTTKDDIFAEVNAKMQTMENELQLMREFKSEVSSQIAEMGKIIRDFINLQQGE